MKIIPDRIAKRFSFSSLRVRLRALVCVAVIPLLLLIIFSNILYRHAKEAEIRDGVITLTNMARNGLDRYIDSTRQLLFTISHTDVIKEGNPSDISAFFSDLHKHFPEYINLGAVDLKGDSFASSVPLKKPVNLSDRFWFQQALKTRDFTIGEYQIGRITGLPVIVFAQPVFDPVRKQALIEAELHTDQAPSKLSNGVDSMGRVKFILFASMELKWMNRLWQDLKLPPDAHLLVTDRNGAVLFHYPDPEKWAGQNWHEIPIVKAMLTRKKGTAEAEGEDGIKRIHAFTSVGAPESSIHITIGISKKAAFKPLNNILTISLILLTLVAGIGILLARLYSNRYIIKPIKALQNATERFSSGDYTSRANLKAGANEIIAYSNVFDRMAEAIEQEIASRKKAEELIKNILESVDEGFIIIDRDFRILSANRAYAEMVKTPIEDILGKHCYEISHHFSRPCFESEGHHPCTVNHAFETGEHSTAVHTHYDKEGNPVYVETKAYPLSKDETGKVLTTIEIIVDITEKRKLEEQLMQSQKMEAVGQLAGGIAHDFNNILTAIIGYSSMLLDKIKEDDPNRHMAQIILESGERAANLTQGLLAFSRRQTISLKPVDINELIRKVERLLQRVIGEDIDLRTVLNPPSPLPSPSGGEGYIVSPPSGRGDISSISPPLRGGDKGEGEGLFVLADAGQIEQALMNLATNARDAMPNGGDLVIGTEPVIMDESFATAHGYGKPGKYALISVSDTGSGMDEKTRLRIFEPFFTTKETGKGTGLGLSIIYGIVKQHEGFINVYSEPGQGTAFKIYLPITKERVEEKKPAESFMETGGAETILVAEDDESVRRFTKSVLEQAGYTVIEAIDGEDALNKFRENKDKIDLLLFDVVMPRMDGKAAYDRISEIRPGLKVIFTSGYTQEHIAKKGVLEEGTEFIYKPASPNALLKKVREVIGKK